MSLYIKNMNCQILYINDLFKEKSITGYYEYDDDLLKYYIYLSKNIKYHDIKSDKYYIRLITDLRMNLNFNDDLLDYIMSLNKINNYFLDILLCMLCLKSFDTNLEYSSKEEFKKHVDNVKYTMFVTEILIKINHLLDERKIICLDKIDDFDRTYICNNNIIILNILKKRYESYV